MSKRGSRKNNTYDDEIVVDDWKDNDDANGINEHFNSNEEEDEDEDQQEYDNDDEQQQISDESNENLDNSNDEAKDDDDYNNGYDNNFNELRQKIQSEDNDDDYDVDNDNNTNHKFEQEIDMDELRNQRLDHEKFFNLVEDDKNYLGDKKTQNQGKIDKIDLNDTILIINKVKKMEELNDSKALESLRKDFPEFTKIVDEFSDKLKEVKERFLPLLRLLKQPELELKNGVDYLNAKFSLLILYCLNLSYLILRKIMGKSINNHPVLKRLIYIKTILSKLKNLDKKLEYQINKLLRIANQQKLVGVSYNTTATTKKDTENDPFSLRPRPENLAKDQTIKDLEIDEANGDIIEAQKTQKYIAPKIASTLMDDDKKARKEDRLQQAKRRKILKNTFLREMEEDIYDMPTEIRKNDYVDEYEEEREKKQRNYEEENFMRMPETKKDKKKLLEKKKRLEGRVDDFEDMDKLRDLLRDELTNKDQMEKEGEIKMKKSLAGYYKDKEFGGGNKSSRNKNQKNHKEYKDKKKESYGEIPRKKVKFH